MDKQLPNPALLRAYSYLANNLQRAQQRTQFPNQLQVPLQSRLVPNQLQLHPQSQPQPQPHSLHQSQHPLQHSLQHPLQHPHQHHNQSMPAPCPPAKQMPAPSPETNACEKLSHLTRSIRGKPVYKVSRIGGEDHDPLFHADVTIMPQNYSAEGAGKSKLIARRNAATSMINFIHENLLVRAGTVPSSNHNGNQVQRQTAQTMPSLPAPKQSPKEQAKVELEEEMEEGELDSDDPGGNEEEEPAFFVDREPDPELEREAESESHPERSSSSEHMAKAEDAKYAPRHSAPQKTKQEDVIAVATAAAAPAVQASVTTNQSMEGASRVEPSEPRQAPKRVRPPPEQELSVAPHGAPSSDINSVIPPRKRAKTIIREFPTRLQVSIFCTYTDDVQNCLKALADANLFVDLSITMFSTVELPKYVLLGRNVAAEVTMLSKEHSKNDAALVAKLAFAVGASSESLWVARAKHLARGYPSELSPRTLVLYDDPSLDVLAEDGVVEVMRPTDEVPRHLAAVLDRAKSASSTAT